MRKFGEVSGRDAEKLQVRLQGQDYVITGHFDGCKAYVEACSSQQEAWARAEGLVSAITDLSVAIEFFLSTWVATAEGPARGCSTCAVTAGGGGSARTGSTCAVTAGGLQGQDYVITGHFDGCKAYVEACSSQQEAWARAEGLVTITDLSVAIEFFLSTWAATAEGPARACSTCAVTAEGGRQSLEHMSPPKLAAKAGPSGAPLHCPSGCDMQSARPLS